MKKISTTKIGKFLALLFVHLWRVIGNGVKLIATFSLIYCSFWILFGYPENKISDAEVIITVLLFFLYVVMSGVITAFYRPVFNYLKYVWKIANKEM